MKLPPFQTLLDAHGREIHRFLTASLGPIDADDCYQETWLAALRAYPKLRDASNLRAWLFTIAHRKVVDHVRARARGAAPVADAAEMAAPAEASTSLDGEVWGAVSALPEKQRTAIALRFIADCAYVEIATAMETSEDAARRNVHEGLKRLRREQPTWNN